MQLLLLFFISLVIGDLYSPYQHSSTLNKRLKLVQSSNTKYEKSLLMLEERERRVLNTLQILYDDMKLAVSQRDRIEIEKQIELRQSVLNKIRRQKRLILRRMRNMADTIAQPYRDEMVRRTRTDERLGYDYNQHIRREIAANHEYLTKETMELAQKYAILSGEIAAAQMESKLENNNEDLNKAKDSIAKAAHQAYLKTYKKIVQMINEATVDGVDTKDIKMVCYSAIQDYAQQIENDHLLLVKSVADAKSDLKRNINDNLKVLAPVATKQLDQHIEAERKAESNKPLTEDEITKFAQGGNKKKQMKR